MAGVGVISSVAVFLFVLLASFSAAREERWTRAAGWKAAKAADAKYLALLKNKGDTTCAGSIPSKWTVLTFCAGATNDSETKAYAGLSNINEATRAGEVHDVKAVAANDNMAGLKICILKDPWTENVGVVKLPSNKERSAPYTKCLVLGFGGAEGAARKLENQTIGPKEQCAVGARRSTTDGVLYSKVTDKTNHQLQLQDFGGPAICDNIQRGINKAFQDEVATTSTDCNLFVDVTKYSDWIQGEIDAAETAGAAGGSGGTGGTGGNGTASSGYSIHSHLNKYSNWKVLWFLVPIIVTFLQY